MKASSLIIACTTGIFIYLLGLGIFGEHGLISLEHKHEQLDRLERHVEELEALQTSILNRVASLEMNAQVQVREANRLGYIADDQVLVRIPVDLRTPSGVSPGSILAYVEYDPPPRGYLFTAAVAAFLVVLMISLRKRRGEDGEPIRP